MVSRFGVINRKSLLQGYKVIHTFSSSICMILFFILISFNLEFIHELRYRFKFSNSVSWPQIIYSQVHINSTNLRYCLYYIQNFCMHLYYSLLLWSIYVFIYLYRMVLTTMIYFSESSWIFLLVYFSISTLEFA